MAVLNLARDHRMVGPRDDRGESWAVQDGRIFTWSESNLRFETAWWLEDDGTPVKDPLNPGHIKALCLQRPFDPAWLNQGATP